MPRPNNGPRLISRQPKGYTQAVYFIRWYESGRKKERSTGASDIATAEEALKEHIASSQRKRDDGPSDPSKFRIAEALDIYGSEKGPKVVDGARVGAGIEPLLEFWGVETIGAISEKTCNEYVKWRTSQQVRGIKNKTKQRRIAVSTTRRELVVLRAAIRYCANTKRITYAPFVHVPPKGESSDAWLTPQMAAAIIRAARREPKARFHLPLFILIGLYTGTRHTAILKLQWQQNIGGGWVDLDHAIMYRAAPGRALATSKRQTPVPIPPRLMTLLRLARRRTRAFVIEYEGKPLKKMKRSFATAVRNAIKDLGPVGMKITPHTLRHTAATWMLQRGVEVWEAAGYLGMSKHMLETTYGHHSPEHLKRARDAFKKHA